ncbi:hypothetical protein [Clostridium sp.]|uniref:hypothetical protein n=1 Tax=Clostridium sp. TaxID=1506 RepID=UPI0025BF6F2E|nr:hypothetical protein [Clostridium sp.]
MKIYNENKTQILNENDLDLTNGYLVEDYIEIQHEEVPYVKEQYHYEVVKEYDNGGKDIVKIIDIKGQEHKDAYIEKEPIQVYKLKTQAMLNAEKIAELKSKLAKTDYQAIKYFEGYLTIEEYSPIRLERQSYREEINKLEDELKSKSETIENRLNTFNGGN